MNITKCHDFYFYRESDIADSLIALCNGDYYYYSIAITFWLSFCVAFTMQIYTFVMVFNEKSIPLKVKFANYLAKAFTFPATFAITFVKHNQYCVTWIYPGFIYDMALYGPIIVLICAPSTFFIFGLYLIKKKHKDACRVFMFLCGRRICLA